MIINIAGTNGSGKTWVVRRLIEAATPIETIAGNDLWKEFGRVVRLTKRDIFIVGRYNNFDTGGADTIKDVSLIYDLIIQYAEKGFDVVYEGSYAMNHMRGLDMLNRMKKADIPVLILHLTTTLPECKASINERRERRGHNSFERDWKNIEGSVVRAKNFADKMRAIGATVVKVSRDEAPVKLMELLSR
jgi:hypothetical protein